MRSRGTCLGALAMAVATLTACSGDDTDVLAAGEAQHALDPVPTAERSTQELRLPHTVVRVTASEALEELPAAESRPEPVTAPDGMGIVEVTVEEASHSPSDAISTALQLDAERPTVRLVNDTRSTELPWVVGGAHFVTVDPGEPILAEVEFDGVVQRVDLRSGERETPVELTGLYQDAAPSDWELQPCRLAASVPSEDDATGLCHVRVSTTMWLPEAGWAERDRPWWTMTLRTGAPDDLDASAEPVDVVATLDGQSAVHSVEGTGTEGSRRTVHLGFPAPESPREGLLRVTATYAVPDGGTELDLAGETVVTAP